MISNQIVKSGTLSGGLCRGPNVKPLNQYGGVGISANTNATLGMIVGYTGRQNSAGSLDFYMLAVDLDDPNFNCGVVKTPFLGHGIAFNPVLSGRAALFEKRGPGACELDISTGKVLREIPCPEDRNFYGHGAYSPDGKILYAAETITRGEYKGLIVMRDAVTMEEIGEFPSYGSRPHDCQILKDGKTMIITNGGGLVGEKELGSVTYVDIESQQLIAKIWVENKRFNAGHVAVAENGNIVVVSAPREGSPAKKNGGVTIGGMNRKLVTAKGPGNILNKMVGETLSVCIDNLRNIAAATTPDAGRITFWDLETQQLVHTIKVTHPRGVTMTLDKKNYIFSYDKPDSKLGMVNAETFEPVQGYDVDIAITGSHLATYS